MAELIAQAAYPNLSRTDSSSRPDLHSVTLEQGALWVMGGLLTFLLLGIVTLGRLGVKRSTFLGALGLLMLVALVALLILVGVYALR